MLCDFHIHPAYSIDARGELEDFVRYAVERKIERMCFTTHIDLEPSRRAIDRFIRLNGKIEYLTKKNVAKYIDDVKAIANKYKGIIDIRVGFEIGWTSDSYNEIKNFLENLDVDFRIGSVHIIDGVAITSRKEAAVYLMRYGVERAAKLYYEELIGAAQSGLFDVLGHIDGYKKYIPLVFNSDSLEVKDESTVLNLLRMCKSNNITFEINTSAILKGHTEFYPSEWILRLAREVGIGTVSLGSDSHSPEFVGYMFDRAEKLINSLGFKIYSL